ncbi:hypothetical protein [uncultured Alistipes sp.]|uniref:hypothetical protein n=1 Tax=uncultured Alistipes sp. TaxID=538949 RepID=UPI00272BC59E|nr:hypothetical protein [uncultured Alistipes sp.]
MVNFTTPEGDCLDLKPGQDLAINIENPFFAEDHIPVAWSTEIELPITPTNCAVFGCPNAMLLPATKREINVFMQVNGIRIMEGKMKLSGQSPDVLKASFCGVSIEDSLTGNLQDLPLAKWNFGKLEYSHETKLYDEIMLGAAKGTREDFVTPLMMRKSEVSTTDSFVDATTVENKKRFATKYMNHRLGNFLTPVVRLSYLMRFALSDCSIDEELTSYFGKIGIVASYRTNGSLDDVDTGCLDKDEEGNFILDLANAMPDVALESLVKNILLLFGASVFIANGQKRIIGNNAILQSSDFVDWSEKIHDDIEQEIQESQEYRYGYTEDSADNSKIDESSVITCQQISDCYKQEAGTTVFCIDTQDYYEVQKETIYFGVSKGETWGRQFTRLLFLRHAIKGDSPSDNNNDTVSAQSNLVPVESHPKLYPYAIGLLMVTSEPYMVPAIETPEIGGTRPTTIYFGCIENVDTSDAEITGHVNPVQLTGNGYYGAFFWMPSITPLYISGDIGLAKFHNKYKEWLAKEKPVVKAQVNLTAHDIANLKIWQKIMLYNQLFYIKALSISLNTSTDIITAEAEFIKA